MKLNVKKKKRMTIIAHKRNSNVDETEETSFVFLNNIHFSFD